MCGLAGILDLNGRREIDGDLLKRMTRRITHRGPDGEGFHLEPGVGLGHRRLSIIDIAGGQQPMFDNSGNIAVVFNGEIYNFVELRKELEDDGYNFSTRCDTEVIIYAWKKWGSHCVEYFNGMFAFALWDKNDETLFLARDRLGIKPLYYALLPDQYLVFGSELKSLLVHPGLPRQIEPEAVEEYFTFGYIPDPKTILRHAHKLAPGYTLLVRRGRQSLRQRQYWDLPFNEGPGNNCEEELIYRLRKAVKARLIAEVPLGAFLSGGVDSSAVVAMMADLSSEPVETCSISFGDPKFNESQFAEIVAKRFKTRHRSEQVNADDFGLIDKLVDLYDEPYADSSAIPTYRVCELARRKVTVALSGDGGDENLAGYRRYRWHTYEERLRAVFPTAFRQSLFGFLGRAYPKLDWAPKILRGKATFQAIARDSLRGYLHSVSIFPEELRRELFSNSFHTELQGYGAENVFKRHFENAPTHHPLSLVQYLDLKTYLPGDILTKVDRASMAHGLEVRVPILDHRFVEWVSGLNPQLKLNGREGKYLFKRALEPHLPREILYRSKMGFAVPLANWFRGPLRDRVRSTLLEGSLSDSTIFNKRTVQRIVDQHQSGLRDHSSILWALLMFDGFHSRVLSA